MTLDTYENDLKNVRLTCMDVYPDQYHQYIQMHSADFDPAALTALLAIGPGKAWNATIVLQKDFDLINEAFIRADSPVVPSSRHYPEMAAIIRAILPDAPSQAIFDSYIAGNSYIVSQAIKRIPWTPVNLLLTLYGGPYYGTIEVKGSCI